MSKTATKAAVKKTTKKSAIVPQESRSNPEGLQRLADRPATRYEYRPAKDCRCKGWRLSLTTRFHVTTDIRDTCLRNTECVTLPSNRRRAINRQLCAGRRVFI